MCRVLRSAGSWNKSVFDRSVLNGNLLVTFVCVQGAEILQLYCELCCDAAQAAARWQQVSQAVMRRDNITKSGKGQPYMEGVDPHLQHIFTTLALTYHEKQAFK